MKINPVSNNNIVSSYLNTNSNIKSNTKNEAEEISDSVEFSEDALKFSAVIKNVNIDLDARDPQELAHIQEVTNKIKNGTYNVDGNKIAQKLLEGTSVNLDA